MRTCRQITGASHRRCRSGRIVTPCAPALICRCGGLARLTEEFVDRLDLHDVTLAGNDTGGALAQLIMQQMRLRPVRRLPIAFGWLTRRGDAATARWLNPVLTRPEIRRDTVRALRAAAADKGLLLQAADCLRSFDRPALVVWAREDRVMPPEHGRRLAELLPQGQLVEVADSYTLIPLDQPARLAQIIREFEGVSGTTPRLRAPGTGRDPAVRFREAYIHFAGVRLARAVTARVNHVR